MQFLLHPFSTWLSFVRDRISYMQYSGTYRSTININLRKVGIITNSRSERSIDFAGVLEKWLNSKSIDYIRNSVEPDLDILITLGGDGTLLRIAEQAARHSIPVVGVNLGNLGFLTELTEQEAIPALEQVLRGDVAVENRMMLKTCLMDSQSNRKSEYRYSLNEVVITKGTLDRLLSLQTSVNGDLITTYKADGLIFSTATGSTAYSLSAGGPLVHPGLATILVTPICPFMLSSRPIILPADQTFSTCFSPNSANTTARIIIDGQSGWKLTNQETLLIEQAEHPLQLIAASNQSYFQVLCNKLHWGDQKKNCTENKAADQ